MAAANLCRVALAPLVANALRIERRGHPTSILSDIAEEEHVTRGIPQEAPAPAGIVSKGLKLATRGRIKNLRDIPGLRSIQDSMVNAESPRIRALGQRLFREDVGGNQANGVITETAVTRERAMLQVHVMQEFKPAYSRWLQSTGKSSSDDAELEFSELVTKTIRRGGRHSNPHVESMAKRAQDGYNRALERGKRSGTFDDAVSPDENYVNRVYAADAFRAAIKNHGIEKVDEVFANAIRIPLRRAGIVINEARLGRLARGMVQNIRDRADGIDLGTQHGLPLDNIDKLDEMLREMDIDPADIEHITAQLKKPAPEKAAIGSAHGRVQLDETAASDDGLLTFEELLENDFRKLFPMYTDRVGADVAFRDTLGVSATESGIMKLVNEVKAEGDKRLADYTEKALRDLSGLRSNLVNPDGLVYRMSKGATNLAYINFGGFFGLASLAETSVVTAKAGYGTALKHLTALEDLRINAETGHLGDPFIDHIAAYTGLGMESVVHPMRARASKWDPIAEDFVAAQTGIEKVLEWGRNATVKYSGIRAITDGQRREVTRNVLSEIERVLLRGGKLGRAQAIRMAQMGYDEASLKVLHAEMNKFGITVEAMNRKVIRADLERWAAESPQTHARFMDAILRESERSIIEVSAGHLPYWMTTPVGRVFAQFMSFTTKAYNVHLLRGANIRDAQVLNNVMGSAIIAALVYYARTSVQYAHDEEERRERLTFGNTVLAGIARSSAGGLPSMFADNAMAALGMPGPFSHSRYSGLDTKVLSPDSTPGVSVLNSAYNTGVNLGQVVLGAKPLTGDDFDRAMRLTPLTLLPAVRNALETLAVESFDLPTDDPR